MTMGVVMADWLPGTGNRHLRVSSYQGESNWPVTVSDDAGRRGESGLDAALKLEREP